MRVIKLCKGTGVEGVSHCVMSATSIINGEVFSDNPICACPTITAALIRINDTCPTDEIREELLGHLPWLIIGTRSEDLSVLVERANLFSDYATAAAATATAAAAHAHAHAAAHTANYAAAHAATANYAAAHAATAAHAAAAANGAASTVIWAAGDSYDWATETKKFIDFIEEKIIPVYTTMTIEPEYNSRLLYQKKGVKD